MELTHAEVYMTDKETLTENYEQVPLSWAEPIQEGSIFTVGGPLVKEYKVVKKGENHKTGYITITAELNGL